MRDTMAMRAFRRQPPRRPGEPVPARSARSGRTTAGASALLTVALIAVTVAVTSGAATGPGHAGAAAFAAAPASTSAGPVALSVDPAGGLDPGSARMTVTGSGYDTGSTLLVAVCSADGKAPAALTECIGGAVPNGNSSKGFGYVTKGGQAAPGGGGVAAKWAADGTYRVDLILPGAAGSAVDCLHAACSVFAVLSGAKQGLAVPVTFATPSTPSTVSPPPAGSPTPTASPSSSATPSSSLSPSPSASPPVSSTVPSSTVPSSTVASSTVAASTVAPSTVLPSTVAPKSIVASVPVGGKQQVLFAGFRPGEPVDVTVFSTPLTLPPVTADSDGIVTIDFVVPPDLVPGTHQVQAIGRESRTTGLARFEVTPAPVVSSSVPPSTPPPTSTPASSTPETSVTAASSTPVTSTVLSPLAGPTPSAPGPVIAAPSSSRPVWPWVVLGLVVLLVVVSLIVGLVTLSRRRAQLAAENAERDRALADAAAQEQQRTVQAASRADADPPTVVLPGGPPGVRDPTDPPDSYVPPGYEPNQHGLLSGQGDEPAPPASDPDPATQILPTEPREPGGPATHAWSPGDDTGFGPAPTGGSSPVAPPTGTDPDGPDSTGPATQTWSLFDDDDEPPPSGRHQAP